MKLILIRHGKTESNRKKAYLGITDEPLCEEGIKELETFKMAGYYSLLEKENVTLYVSPMLRAIQTAKMICPNHIYTKIDEFREMNFGVFEGKNYQELTGNPEYQIWVDGMCTGKIPGGESRDEYIERVMQGFSKVMRQEVETNPNNTTVVIVAHGGTIMAILSTLTGRDYYDFQVENGRGYIVEGNFEDEVEINHVAKIM